MRYLLAAFLLSISFSCFCQHFSLPTGEFMDTTFTISPTCVSCKNAYYYQVQGKYPKSSATLLTEVTQYLSNLGRTYKGSGYVTFHLLIDCQGKPSQRVHVLQTDENYKPYHFTNTYVDDLFNYVKSLHQWKAIKYNSIIPVNYYTYLSFKIKNGKVISVLP